MSNGSYVVLGADGSEQILDADEIGIAPTPAGSAAAKLQALLNQEFTALDQMIAVIVKQVRSSQAKYPQAMSPVIASLNNLSAEVSNCRSNLAQQLISSGVGNPAQR